MSWIKNNWIYRLIVSYKATRRYRKKLEEIRKRDPHIYK